jgi:DNA repair exonuclease SbcCD ATPase subunit
MIPQRFNNIKAKRDLFLETLQQKRSHLESGMERKNHLVKARWVIAEVSKNTQEAFRKHMEELSTMVVNSIFEDRDFKFKLNFEQKRNKVECELLIQEGDSVYRPRDELGGGIVDVLSFALRIVLWSMENPRSRNIIILDEPFRFVSKALMSKVGKVLQEISHKLNIQIILVTHEQEIAESADKSWSVSHNDGKSILTPFNP